MQCSCGAATRTAYYQKTVLGVLYISTQEICTGCGRVSTLRGVTSRGKPSQAGKLNGAVKT